MVHWFKRDGDKAMPNNKYGLLLCYHETCTPVVAAVTYREDDITGVGIDVTADADVATVAAASCDGIGVPTADVGGTGIIWSLSTATAAQPVASCHCCCSLITTCCCY
jgi:hypothetical protein